MHSQRLPSSFFTKRTGKPHRDLVGQMKPFCVFLSRNLQSATSSGGDKEYIGPEIGFAPSSSVIPRSYGLLGGRVSALSPEKTSWNSWYSMCIPAMWSTVREDEWCRWDN